MARCLFLYRPAAKNAKNGFYIFQCLGWGGGGKESKEEEYLVTCENYIKFKFQRPYSCGGTQRGACTSAAHGGFCGTTKPSG